MLRSYLDAAMRHAHYEQLEGGEGFYGEIPGFDGLWASSVTRDACVQELASALEDWVVAGLQLGHDLPFIDGMTLPIPSIV
jgi:hypothetical protein